MLRSTLSCWTKFTSHTTCNRSVPLFLSFSGNQYRLPGLSRSTSPSAPSLHKRSGSTSIFYGPRGKEDNTDLTHLRRRSDSVPVRALLLLPDWSIGHEVGSRSPRVSTPYGGVSIFCIRARPLLHSKRRTSGIVRILDACTLFSLGSAMQNARCPR